MIENAETSATGDMATSGATEPPAGPGDGAKKQTEPRSSKDWLEEIAQAERDMRPFTERCRKLAQLYARQREDGETVSSDRRFALLWSNIEILKQTTYANPPKPAVRRRFSDRDQTARVAADLLQRALSSIFERADIDSCLRKVRDDFLLTARGTAWVRYVPSFTPKAYGAETVETLYDETLAFDFVHWSDFIQPKCRSWADLPWVARRVFLDEERFKTRFGKDAYARMQASKAAARKKDNIAKSDKATICTYEVWSKRDEKVIWLARDSDFILDERAPLYDLRDFWPCPRPAFGTLATDSLVPVPDYVYYQDQAEEIDDLTRRIGALSDALKLVGFYPAAAEGETSSAIEKAISPYTSNQLIPVPGWAAFVQGGGARQLVEWLPVDMVVRVLQGCIELRKQLVEDVYQITGISDILRGSTVASETATAQSIKAQWGSIRIRERQAELARFAADLTRIAAEIVAEKFQPETLWKLTGLTFPSAAEKAELIQRLDAERLDTGNISLAQAPASLPAPMQGLNPADRVPAGVAPMGADPMSLDPMGLGSMGPDPMGPPAGAGGGMSELPVGIGMTQGAMSDSSPPAPPLAPPAPQAAPLTDEERKMAMLPSQEDVIALIRDDCLRSYRVEIETDSTLEADEQAEKAARNEFLSALGQFISQAVPMAQAAPELVPMLGEALMFAVRGYRAGHQLEDVVQQAVDELAEKAKGATEAPPQDPALQFEREKFAAEREERQAKLGLEREVAAGRLQFEREEAQAKLAREQEESDRAYSLKVAAHNKEMMASLGAAPEVVDALGRLTQNQGMLAQSQESLAQGQAMLLAGQHELAAAVAAMARMLAAPKTILRGPDGRVSGVMVSPLPPMAPGSNSVN